MFFILKYFVLSKIKYFKSNNKKTQKSNKIDVDVKMSVGKFLLNIKDTKKFSKN